jgi:hypothetical protein
MCSVLDYTINHASETAVDLLFSNKCHSQNKDSAVVSFLVMLAAYGDSPNI